MMLHARLLLLQILPLNPAPAAAAQAAVQLVVVQLAVGAVVEHVEGRRREGRGAGRADEAGLVVAPCQAAVGRRDGLAFDGEVAGFAAAAGGGSVWRGLELWRRGVLW